MKLLEALLCLIGINHDWRFISANPLGEHWYRSRLIQLSSVFMECRKCKRKRFKIVPGKWNIGLCEKIDSELDQLKKMAGLE